MTTVEQALFAKHKLRATLQRPGWLRGTGIASDAQGHFIVVNVSEDLPEIRAQLPDVFEDVRVVVKVVGDIIAL